MAKGESWITEAYKEKCIEILTGNLSVLHAKAGLTQKEVSYLI